MALIKLGGLFLLAGMVSSMAIGGVAPTVALNEPKPCEYYGDCIEVELWGYRVQRLVNTSTAALQARAGGQTKLDVGKDRIRQETVSFQDDPAPPADFKALWDKILEACYGKYFTRSQSHFSPCLLGAILTQRQRAPAIPRTPSRSAPSV